MALIGKIFKTEATHDENLNGTGQVDEQAAVEAFHECRIYQLSLGMKLRVKPELAGLFAHKWPNAYAGETVTLFELVDDPEMNTQDATTHYGDVNDIRCIVQVMKEKKPSDSGFDPDEPNANKPEYRLFAYDSRWFEAAKRGPKK
jgi:hypothetical protein